MGVSETLSKPEALFGACVPAYITFGHPLKAFRGRASGAHQQIQ